MSRAMGQMTGTGTRLSILETETERLSGLKRSLEPCKKFFFVGGLVVVVVVHSGFSVLLWCKALVSDLRPGPS